MIWLPPVRRELVVDFAVRLFDLAVGQRFLQLGDARVGDVGVREANCLQVGQPL